MDTVALSVVFDKYYPIMDYLGLKDSSRRLQANCTINYLFYLYLIFHICALKFNVTRKNSKILQFFLKHLQQLLKSA